MSALLDAIYSAFILLVAAAGVVYVIGTAGDERVGGSTVARVIAIAVLVVFIAALVGSLVLPKFFNFF